MFWVHQNIFLAWQDSLGHPLGQPSVGCSVTWQCHFRSNLWSVLVLKVSSLVRPQGFCRKGHCSGTCWCDKFEVCATSLAHLSYSQILSLPQHLIVSHSPSLLLYDYLAIKGVNGKWRVVQAGGTCFFGNPGMKSLHLLSVIIYSKKKVVCWTENMKRSWLGMG